MKVLMVSLPFTGHVNPTLGLAKAFVDGGHDVTFILTDDWKEAIQKTGAQYIPYDNFPINPTPFELRRLSFKSAYETAYRIGKDFDVVVYEMLFFLGKNCADRLGLPSIRLFSTFALDNELLNRFVYTGGPLMGLLKSNTIRKWITDMLIGNITIGSEDLLSEIAEDVPGLNFVFTTKEFQVNSEKFSDSNFKFIGPSISARNNDERLKISHSNSPLIYISLGSMLNNSKGFYKRCIEAFRNENVSVIMSIGKKVNIEDLGEIPSNVKVYSCVPQLQVLENADLFITHGGMNSVNEALYFGVPMVVLPLATDQPTIADRIVELNLGRRFSNKSPSVEEIRSQAMSVLSDKSILEQSNNFQSFSRQAKGTSYAVIEAEKYIEHRQSMKERYQDVERL